MSSSVPIGDHPNADKTALVTGYAVASKDSPLAPWSYHPRPMDENMVHIKISHCGICGSDLHTMDSEWGPTIYPVIVGHEIIGRVTEKGSNVKHLEVGDLVGVGAQAWACLKSSCDECKSTDDQHCPSTVYTYNSKYADGQIQYGGYADGVRVHSEWAFKIPDGIKPDEAAPLLCAGATVFAPLQRYNVKGKRVAVIGIGGLGHLAVQFAAKMGASSVTAVSTSTSKKDDAFKLGATHFLNSSNPEEIKAARRSFDVVIHTAPSASAEALDTLLTTVALGGYFCVVALPEHPFQIKPFTLVGNRIHFCGSSIASRQELHDMLQFAATHGVRPWIETLPMSECAKGVQKVRDNNVRFRVVLENPQ